MNAEEYKRLTNQNDVLDHSTLNITLKELISIQEYELVENLKRILANNKIDKPALHSKTSDPSSTYYKVDLMPDEIEKIVSIFLDLEAAHVGKNGETTPTASFYASLVDKWNNIAEG